MRAWWRPSKRDLALVFTLRRSRPGLEIRRRGREAAGRAGFEPALGLLESGLADQQELARLGHRLECLLEAQISLFERAEPVVELLESLLVGKVAPGSRQETSSTSAVSEPFASCTFTLCPRAVARESRSTAPVNASRVME